MDMNKEIYKICQLIGSALWWNNKFGCPIEYKYIKDPLNVQLRSEINNLCWLIHYFESLIEDYNNTNKYPHKLTKYLDNFKKGIADESAK